MITTEGRTANEAERCPQTILTAAYLDGDMDAESAASFELHARACSSCSASLLEQRRLLCLLDAAFDESFATSLQLPSDFTRELKARARTDLSGVRVRAERVRALKICVALFVATSVLLGATAFDSLKVLVAENARLAFSLLGMMWRVVADAWAGFGVILKAVGGMFAANSEPLLLLQWTALAGAVFLLFRLISSYHRASAGE